MTLKIFLFAGIIGMMILPFSTMSNTFAQGDTELETEGVVGPVGVVNELTKQEFKDDIRELIDDADTKDFQAKSNKIKAEYDEFFNTVIEQSRIDSETRYLTNAEITNVKNYIFDETIKDEKLKALQESDSADKIDVGFLEWFGIQTANAACPSTTNPSYKQLRLDINGGTYNNNTYNGNNDLYLVLHQDNLGTCERMYTLSFLDEDHPYLDSFYDGVRLFLFNRTFDIESFVIKNNNQIIFGDTWSSSNSYDCTRSSLDHRGCHSTTTKSYTPGQTIYVSNTWNHMMDTSDTNRSLSKVSVP